VLWVRARLATPAGGGVAGAGYWLDELLAGTSAGDYNGRS
jgi:hypothetical protein